MKIDANYARECFDYDQQSGVLTWKTRPPKHFRNTGDCKRWNAKWPGKIAGGIDRTGYRKVEISGRNFLNHRLAWLIMTGEWPINQIDHINGNTWDNRWVNLRAVTNAQNRLNAKLPRNNKSGQVGVSWDAGNKRWRAQIKVNGLKIHLGSFLQKDDAIAVRQMAQKKYNFHENHGRVPATPVEATGDTPGFKAPVAPPISRVLP